MPFNQQVQQPAEFALQQPLLGKQLLCCYIPNEQQPVMTVGSNLIYTHTALSVISNL